MSLIEIDINPAVFVPAYRHLLHSDADIDILYGGRNGAKSHFVAQKSVIDSLHNDYFRMALIKKTYESIKDSQWKTIQEIIEDWKLSEFFRFTKSPLEIFCQNGNQFLARGCDNPQKIKSIRNPSHAWYEEADQLSEEDYITASTSLRTNRGKVKEYLTFNPEAQGDYKKHWIFKNYYAKEVNRMYGTFSSVREIKIPGEKNPITVKYTSTHTTYHDNPWCKPEDKAKLELLKETNPYYYQVYTLGKWGIKEVTRPFMFNFKHEKHVGKCTWNKNEITYVTFDFNKDPISCTVIQFYDGHVYCIESIKLKNSDIKSLCRIIKTRYEGAIFIVTGDYSGTNRSALVPDDYNYYTAIQEELDIDPKQIQVIRNPVIEENQVFMNKAFHLVPITIDEENCAGLIFDLMFAEMLPTGKLRKGDREDEAQQLDLLDGLRYFFNTIVAPEVNL